MPGRKEKLIGAWLTEKLDERYIEEHDEENVPGSLIIPLAELNERVHELDRNSEDIVYCRSGNRSVVGSMILKRNNYKSFNLEGGICL